jgi:hypothetical protein
MAWIGRELGKNDTKSLVPLVERAPRAAALFVQAALARGDAFKGWWYGAWRDGQTLEAVMAIDNHQGSIYADNPDAARGFAEQLFGMQKRFGSGGAAHRHQLIGEARTMSVIWPIVRELPGRKLLLDKECDLLQASRDELPAPSSRVTLELAQRADERILYDFTAELRIEQLGFDPRKIGRDAHVQRVSELVAYGRELIAKEKDNGRPCFVAELAPLSDTTLLLTDAWVPPHYRTRSKLIAQSFWAAARHPAVSGKELVFLAADATLATAAKAVGWKRLAGYRWTVTHG